MFDHGAGFLRHIFRYFGCFKFCLRGFQHVRRDRHAAIDHFRKWQAIRRPVVGVRCVVKEEAFPRQGCVRPVAIEVCEVQNVRTFAVSNVQVSRCPNLPVAALRRFIHDKRIRVARDRREAEFHHFRLLVALRSLHRVALVERFRVKRLETNRNAGDRAENDALVNLVAFEIVAFRRELDKSRKPVAVTRHFDALGNRHIRVVVPQNRTRSRRHICLPANAVRLDNLTAAVNVVRRHDNADLTLFRKRLCLGGIRLLYKRHSAPPSM